MIELRTQINSMVYYQIIGAHTGDLFYPQILSEVCHIVTDQIDNTIGYVICDQVMDDIE